MTGPAPQVASTFRGLTREDALRQAQADVVGARSNGYDLERQDWSEEGGVQVLTVTYRYTGNVIATPMPAYPSPAFVATPTGRSKIVGALLAIFLGGLGVHKFYNGKVAQGVLYLLFFWTFVPAIIGFIEGIWYLTMSDSEYAIRFPVK